MPVVATMHDDIPEVTRNGESAILVPERDTEALTIALATILQAPDRWPAMGAAGRRHVLAEYHQDRSLATLAGHYDEARELRRCLG
jgi:colanic acid/amylovoran biosynthesis glycosyltransferase